MNEAEAKASYDSDAGILRCHLKGLLTLEIIADYEKSLLLQAAIARRVTPRVLMLFDSQDSVVQPTDIVERLRQVGMAVRRPGDRLAVVVGSALQKMQGERAIQGQDNDRIFRSVEEAEAWLKA